MWVPVISVRYGEKEERTLYNVEALEFVLSVIKENPERWNQNDWSSPIRRYIYNGDGSIARNEDGTVMWNSCGTAYCVAGFVTAFDILDGKDVEWKGHGSFGTLNSALSIPYSEEEASFWDRGYERKLTCVAEYAAKRLGLNYVEQQWLFAGNRSLEDIEEFLDAMRKQDSDRVMDVIHERTTESDEDCPCPDCYAERQREYDDYHEEY